MPVGGLFRNGECAGGIWECRKVGDLRHYWKAGQPLRTRVPGM